MQMQTSQDIHVIMENCLKELSLELFSYQHFFKTIFCQCFQHKNTLFIIFLLPLGAAFNQCCWSRLWTKSVSSPLWQLTIYFLLTSIAERSLLSYTMLPCYCRGCDASQAGNYLAGQCLSMCVHHLHLTLEFITEVKNVFNIFCAVI